MSEFVQTAWTWHDLLQMSLRLRWRYGWLQAQVKNERSPDWLRNSEGRRALIQIELLSQPMKASSTFWTVSLACTYAVKDCVVLCKNAYTECDASRDWHVEWLCACRHGSCMNSQFSRTPSTQCITVDFSWSSIDRSSPISLPGSLHQSSHAQPLGSRPLSSGSTFPLKIILFSQLMTARIRTTSRVALCSDDRLS